MCCWEVGLCWTRWVTEAQAGRACSTSSLSSEPVSPCLLVLFSLSVSLPPHLPAALPFLQAVSASESVIIDWNVWKHEPKPTFPALHWICQVFCSSNRKLTNTKPSLRNFTYVLTLIPLMLRDYWSKCLFVCLFVNTTKPNRTYILEEKAEATSS